jgi:uncharacterized protein (TIGR02421 family)
MDLQKPTLTRYQKMVHSLSARVVRAQRPIRILNSIKWDPRIKEAFFKAKFKKLPHITPDYYLQNNPLPFDPIVKNEEFYDLERDIRKHLGQFSAVGHIMRRMCREYREVVRMLSVRGKPEFTKISQELYGSSEDAFYAGAPNLKDLAQMVCNALLNLQTLAPTERDEKNYSSEDVVAILQKRMSHYFKGTHKPIRVKLSDGIIADASAGADTIRIRRGVYFSDRDLRALEVHEGWVHVGTTLNGLEQPICTFLSKGPPSSSVTQEGLAIIIEIFTFSSYPARVRRLTDRILAVHMAEKGANFIEVFDFYREQGFSDDAAYTNAMRIFRGSLPTGGPFTKDLVYSKGFILIYNYIRLAIRQGSVNHIPLLFTGKTTLQDLHLLADLIDEGLVTPPKFLPPPFVDLAALSAWMCYSNFLNSLDLERIALEYRCVL